MFLTQVMNKLQYSPRIIMDHLQACLKVSPVVVVTGARQVGKSTLVQNIPDKKKRLYYTLDDIDDLGVLERNPYDIFQKNQQFIIDEVQIKPDLLKVIKQVVDKKRQPGKFILTGSANLLLMSNVSESLAGRASHLTVRPMTWGERSGSLSNIWSRLIKNNNRDWLEIIKSQVVKKQNWLEAVKVGGFPEPALHIKKDSDRAIWFEGYLKTYLERDLRSLAAISSLPDFNRLMRLVCIQIGQITAQVNLGRQINLTQSTTNRYLNLMEASYMLTRLPAYTANISKRLIKSPKFYWSDSGLALHISRQKPNGFHLENLILNNILTWCDNNLGLADVFHWRTANDYEVDFIIESADRLIPIEVKATSLPKIRDTVSLQVFLKDHKQAEAGLLLHAGEKIEWVTPNILAFPWWLV